MSGGEAAFSEGGSRSEERAGARNRQRRGTRPRNWDCTVPVVIHAGIARLHQASRPQRHRDAAGTGTGTRTNLFLKSCITEPALAHAFPWEEDHLAVPLFRGPRRV